MKPADRWKVSYENLQWKAGKRPFFRNSTIVTAPSRKDAIYQVQYFMFSPPVYGNYRASKVIAQPESPPQTPAI